MAQSRIVANAKGQNQQSGSPAETGKQQQEGLGLQGAGILSKDPLVPATKHIPNHARVCGD